MECALMPKVHQTKKPGVASDAFLIYASCWNGWFNKEEGQRLEETSRRDYNCLDTVSVVEAAFP
jgi:hypothetical protein